MRTDYTLSDKEFMKIAQEVVEGYGSGELGGYYWLGVIYLTDEEGRENKRKQSESRKYKSI